MTQAHERSATLSQMVAEEIRALMARRRMSGRQLAGKLGVSPSWVSYRLTGAQPIDVNDLAQIAGALGVGIHELLPSPEEAARAVKFPYPEASPSARPTTGVHLALRPIGGGRRDPSRPASTVRASSRRPAGGRPADRPRVL